MDAKLSLLARIERQEQQLIQHSEFIGVLQRRIEYLENIIGIPEGLDTAAKQQNPMFSNTLSGGLQGPSVSEQWHR